MSWAVWGVLAILACGGAEPSAPEAAAPEAAPADGVVFSGQTQGRKYAVDVRFDPPAPRAGQLFAAEATVRLADGTLLEDGVVRMNAGMPHHGHGMETDPEDLPGTCEDDAERCTHPGGVYRTEGFKFHMGGDWTVTVEVEGPRGLDRTSFVHAL